MSEDLTVGATSIHTAELATALTVAWLSNANNRISVDDVPAFLTSMHQTIAAFSGGGDGSDATAAAAPEYTPAVSVRKSLASPDHILSMIDGKAYKTLRRHLNTNGLTPEEYRERYNLKSDYPMVAANYSESRRAMAKRIRLGRKKGEAVPAAAKPTTRSSRKSNT